jgi:hypothetical protein
VCRRPRRDHHAVAVGRVVDVGAVARVPDHRRGGPGAGPRLQRFLRHRLHVLLYFARYVLFFLACTVPRAHAPSPPLLLRISSQGSS